MKGLPDWKCDALAAEDLELLLYGHIIKYYMRYVLLRSAKYTNRTSEAASIAVYTLLTTCALVRNLRHTWQLAGLVDLMIDIIGQDITKNKSRKNPEATCRKSAILLPDEGMRELVKGLNMLDEFSRHVLVLYHVETMSPKALSRIYATSVGDIRSQIQAAEKRLAKHLVDVAKDRLFPPPEDVCLLLDELSRTLDFHLMEHVAVDVLSFLAASDKDVFRVCKYPPHWILN